VKILRPRTIVGAACVVCIFTMGICLYVAGIWTAYERLEHRRRVPSGTSIPMPTNLLSSSSDPVKPGKSLAYSSTVTKGSGLPDPASSLCWGRDRWASTQALECLATAAAGLCGLAGRELDLFHALIARESTWRHYDAQGRVLRSSAGALGLAQVMPSTARELGLDARDVWQNALAGACTLRRNLDRRGGDHRKALHDYHAGAWRKRTTRATHDYSNDIMGSAQ